MSAAKQLDWISVEDYLAAEELSDVRHEYVGGTVYAMAGGLSGHGRIGTNIVIALGVSLRGKQCEVFGPDTLLNVNVAGQPCFFYPDAAVICDPNSRNSRFESRPVVLVEVLSKSTRQNDLYTKLIAYCSIPTLKAYLLVEQKPVGITLHRRTAEGFAVEHYSRLSDVIPLPEIEGELPVAEIYAGIEIEPE